MIPYRSGPIVGLLLLVGVGIFAAKTNFLLPPRDSQFSAGGVIALNDEEMPYSDYVDDRRSESDIQDDQTMWQRWQEGSLQNDAGTYDIPVSSESPDFGNTVPSNEPWNVPSDQPDIQAGPEIQLPPADDPDSYYRNLPDGTVIFRNPDGSWPEGPFYTRDDELVLWQDENGNPIRSGDILVDAYGNPIDSAAFSVAVPVSQPWYVTAFPGMGNFFQPILPHLYPITIAAPAPAAAPVYVAPAPQPRPQPSCWISASPTDVAYGGSATLQWNSFNTSRATLSTVGDVSVSGSRTVGGITSPRTFTLNVYNPTGSGSCYTRVSVSAAAGPASCIISANPDTIVRGQSANVAWGSSNAVRASLSGVGSVNVKGGINLNPPQTTDYTLTVYNSGGQPSTCSARVLVR